MNDNTHEPPRGGAALDHPRRCQARRSNGEPCRRYAYVGATVCGHHGGKAPQVKRKARQRIDEAQDRMAKALLGIADSGESEAVRLQAIKTALALGGFTEKTAVELSVPEAPPWAQALQGMRGIARESQRESQARRGQLPPPLALPAADPAEPIDAEITDPPPAQPDGPHYEPQWVQAAKEDAATASSGGGYLDAEDAASFTADLQRRQDARLRAERRSGRIKRVQSRRV
ncbi:hypothetical protein H7J08_07885 [Mycobacterium frederiksbergense]|uniref:hypothetical protein n=1 Tax=Mycolicibacterium frederiksbergense TaxID=117567 RepID=UPI0021F368E5|nr:hypothetical protein [Mycolicibacterium frederiksbergense]MCV7044592.1 hypothetical protein [Mycolicibacterium frederiksbergense]